MKKRPMNRVIEGMFRNYWSLNRSFDPHSEFYKIQDYNSKAPYKPRLLTCDELRERAQQKQQRYSKGLALNAHQRRVNFSYVEF